MKPLLNSIFIISLIVAISCNRNADVIRELHYIDLLNPENKAFLKYPNEFSTYLLKGVIDEEIESYYIDYDSSGQIVSLPLTLFIQKILEPYEEYAVGEDMESDVYSMEDVHSFISSVTLLSFDELLVSGEAHTNYINFYHPGDVTLEGIDKYICSIKFEEAIEFINSKYSPLLWHNYKVEDWGWYNDRLFIPQFETSSKLAIDMLLNVDSTVLSSRLSDSISFQKIEALMADNPYYFSSRFDHKGEGALDIIYKNDSISQEIATFLFDDIILVSRKKNSNDSVRILPVTTAISSGMLKREDRIKRISENGQFRKPLRGPDPLAKKRSENIELPEELPPSQKFYFRTIDRLIGKDHSIPKDLPNILYEGVRDGLITVYQRDSLKSRLLPGNFFNNLILDDQDNIIAESKYLQVYQVITETTFEQSGRIVTQRPIGLGLVLPGKHVPEGINRPIGYFRLSDVAGLLKSKGMEEIPTAVWKGYPLQSWNVEVMIEN
jgi:hypothetical protein